MSDAKPTVPGRAKKLWQIITWCMWDAGGASVNAVATTFVFTVYLTSTAFGNQTHSSKVVGWALMIGGIIVALTAPITGQRADRRGKGTFWLGVFSAIVIVSLALMFFVYPSPSFLWLGAILLTIMTVFFEFATVNYYAMLNRISTPKNIGRISGIGWASGYFGGIFLLMFLNYGFISENNFFGIDTSNGFGVRISMVVGAVWSIIFFTPVLFAVRGRKQEGADNLPRESLVQSYKNLWQTIKVLFKKAPHVLYFLVASAIFRDGLTGVFTFGGIIAAVTFGFTPGEVIIFAVLANILAGISTTAFGFLDDKIGPKKVMMISLIMLVAISLIVFFGHNAGKTLFWIVGLLLTLWVGPAQSASRTFLARRIPEGNEGEVFGLYQTTGRAVSFLAPAMFTAFITLGEHFTGYYAPGQVAAIVGVAGAGLPTHTSAQYWGILGIGLILLIGLLLLLPVKENDARLDHISHEAGLSGAAPAKASAKADSPANPETTQAPLMAGTEAAPPVTKRKPAPPSDAAPNGKDA